MGVNGQQLAMEVDTGASVFGNFECYPDQSVPEVPARQLASHPDHLHRRAVACCGTDEGGGELYTRISMLH